MDEYGYFHHLSRLKDVVIRGGENIYPKEVEDFLHTHPKIADVYVVGVPDARMGEELCACVRLVKGEQMSPQELKDYCKDKVAFFITLLEQLCEVV
jgi:acyl-CoA synthetase (AMP-forming)/AMP-acid ligase II